MNLTIYKEIVHSAHINISKNVNRISHIFRELVTFMGSWNYPRVLELSYLWMENVRTLLRGKNKASIMHILSYPSLTVSRYTLTYFL